MKAFAHSVEIDPRIISPPTMNYGQHQRFPKDARREYRYEMTLDEFRGKIAESFAAFRQGEIEDTYDEEDAAEFPSLFDWRSKGYPNLDSLIADDHELLVELLKYWEYDISHSLTEFVGNKPSEWIVMSIDEIRLTSESAHVVGVAYKRRLRQ
jgi:hypothetical protein